MLNGKFLHIKYELILSISNLDSQFVQVRPYIEDMMIKAFLSILIVFASATAAPTLNLNKLQNIQRFIDGLESPPTLYRGHIPTYGSGIHGYLHIPIIPAMPALRLNGVTTVYVPPQGYYNPHTGQLTGQVVGTYPVPYNGYAHAVGFKN